MKLSESLQFKTPENEDGLRTTYYVGSKLTATAVILDATTYENTTEFTTHHFVSPNKHRPNPNQTVGDWEVQEDIPNTLSRPHNGDPYATIILKVEVSPPLEPEDRQKAAEIIGVEILSKLDNPFGPDTIGPDLIESGVPFDKLTLQTRIVKR